MGYMGNRAHEHKGQGDGAHWVIGHIVIIMHRSRLVTGVMAHRGKGAYSGCIQ